MPPVIEELPQKPLNAHGGPTEHAAPVVAPPAAITIPDSFCISPVDYKHDPKRAPSTTPQPPLGVLEAFTGEFAGTGFNTIFRPNSGPPTTTTFTNPVTPAPPNPPSENVLELNLTTETLTFSKPLGSVPNRGLEKQNDILLNGVPYVQSINDVTNTATGKADGTPNGIHFEPGLWMHVPATTTDPVVGESLCRMASIPHGTTINAQALSAPIIVNGPPTIPRVDITPFIIGFSQTSNPGPIPFASQTAANTDTPRIPQDLTKFIAEGTITQDILHDPNTVLRNAIKGQKITKTIIFIVSTVPPTPGLGGGTQNIAFLEGFPPTVTIASQTGPNASAVQMSAVFWIETVEHQIVVPPFKLGQDPFHISPPPHQPGAKVPIFRVQPPHEITAPKTITVTSTQIQYSQNVSLNFAGLSWPHVSVATLVPTTVQTVPPNAWH